MPAKRVTPTVYFHFQSPVSLRDRRRLKAFLIKLARREQTPVAELRYIFCDDAYLLAINKEFLQHDSFTDIITFNLAAKGEPVSGEIYISVDRVKENAALFKSSRLVELRRVMFHGLLHLCGYADKSPKDKKTMRQKEDEYLKRYK